MVLPGAGWRCSPHARVWLGADQATHSSFRRLHPFGAVRTRRSRRQRAPDLCVCEKSPYRSTRHEPINHAWLVRLPPRSQKHRYRQQVGHSLIVLVDGAHRPARGQPEKVHLARGARGSREPIISVDGRHKQSRVDGANELRSTGIYKRRKAIQPDRRSHEGFAFP